MHEPNNNLIGDLKNQLITSETEIKENEKLLAEIEPGFWMRKITGSLFLVIEIILYVLVIGLVVSTIWLNANWFTISMAMSNSTTVDVSIHNNSLQLTLYILNGIFIFAALINLLLALLLRKSRRNLFKLASVSEYLEKTLKDRKAHRDKIFDSLVQLEKQVKL